MFAQIGKDGWRSPENPPNDDRTVQIAWDDMSYGCETVGFYDSIAGKEKDGKVWWVRNSTNNGYSPLKGQGFIGAWREI